MTGLFRRASPVLALLVLAVLLTPAPAPAAVGATIVEDAFFLEVTDGANDEFDELIDVSVFTPVSATPTDPAPVVVFAHGFGGSKASTANAARQVAANGYVGVAYSARGFGQSSGGIGLDSIHYDLKDAQQLLDHLATRPEVELDGPGDPRVGITGFSYGGGIALMLATNDDRVDAIVPAITWSSLVYALAPNNLGFDLDAYAQPTGVTKIQWTSFFFAVGSLQPVIDPNSPPGFPIPGCAGFVTELCAAYAATAAAGRADDNTISVLKNSSPASFADGLDVPTFLIQGQDDTLFNLNDAARNYRAAENAGVPLKMLWFNGGHSGSNAPGELDDESTSPSDIIFSRQLRWWDRHLSGDTSVDTGPGFEWYQPWVDHDETDVETSYAAADSYPAFAPVEVGLGADGVLSLDPAAATAGELPLTNPAGGMPSAYSETSAVQAQVGLAPMEIAGQHARFDTPPLASAVELVGLPQLTLPVSSLTGEAVLFAKLYDVAPDGSVELIRRLSAPVWAEDLGTPLEVVLAGTVHRFEPGHRIRLVIATTDTAYANRQVADVVTLSVGPGARLELPLSAALAETNGSGNGSGNGSTTTSTTSAAFGGGSGGATILPATGGNGRGAPVVPFGLGVTSLAVLAAIRRTNAPPNRTR